MIHLQDPNIYIYILQTCLLSVVEVLFCSNLKDDLCKLNLVLNSFSVSPIYVWKLKNKNINFNIKWEVVKKVKPFTPSDKVCKLCLQEKLSILRSAPSLKKRSEIFGHRIHRKKFLLSNTNKPLSTDEVSL